MKRGPGKHLSMLQMASQLFGVFCAQQDAFQCAVNQGTTCAALTSTEVGGTFHPMFSTMVGLGMSGWVWVETRVKVIDMLKDYLL